MISGGREQRLAEARAFLCFDDPNEDTRAESIVRWLLDELERAEQERDARREDLLDRYLAWEEQT